MISAFATSKITNHATFPSIGELVLDTTNESLSLQVPSNGCDYFLVKETSKSLLRRLESGSKSLKICLGLLASVGLVIGEFCESFVKYTSPKVQ